MESIDEQLQAFGSMMKGRSAVKRAKKERRILRAIKQWTRRRRSRSDEGGALPAQHSHTSARASLEQRTQNGAAAKVADVAADDGLPTALMVVAGSDEA
ncbi:hypothetical protein PF005_g26592 [Phytophthora fragariae]|uniref:Uncharacterized protein n=1 Tax=Phytophthora fragariae TaxID=53985 RepID=A0A6A3VWV0_9STRA|nr:hypothetical protein PF005_g26592 [Phytophthora fragariae]